MFVDKIAVCERTLTALMSVIFVRVVQTIIVAVTNVYSRNAVSIVTCEKITKAGASFRFAVLWRFVCTIAAVIVTITVPGSGDASVVGTPVKKILFYNCVVGVPKLLKKMLKQFLLLAPL